jgi:radical SAM superfamily enzyme YgiQ (UPF0313 family)
MCAKVKRSTPQKTEKVSTPLSKPVQKPTPVLYIHPAKQGTTYRADKNMGRPYGVIPVGVPALVNTLRQNNIPVRGVIHPLELSLNPEFDLASWISSFSGVKVILIDLHWYEHSYGSIEIAEVCKQVLPGVWIILGGLTATGFAWDILDHFEEVDFVVRGDAEKPLLELVQCLLSSDDPAQILEKVATISNICYRDADKKVILNPEAYCATTEDLDALDFIHLNFLDHAREYLVHEYIVSDIETAHKKLDSNQPLLGRWLCTARGCKFNCSYCGGSKAAHKILAGRNGIVVRSPEKILEDMLELRSQGVVQASMTYDIAELGEEYWRTLLDGIKKKGLRMGIYNEFFQMPEPEFIDAFAGTVDKEFSSVAITPLSGNERVRRLNGKHYSNEKLFDLLEHLSQHKLYIFIYFSLNLPGENQETFRETLDLAREIYEFYPSSLLKILNTVHTMDPLAPMNIAPEKYGVKSTMKTFRDFYTYCFNTQFGGPDARTGKFRGIELENEADRSLEEMANAWDNERIGREKCWWPIPPSW